ncbi:hypothetical protein [Nonomuraea sp. NPDC001831]|uniref:hypothetical protein n=1 Tax=Nonomuraea sp. NPDC001831 TaxID=3364340 RepID=UPI003673F5FE
MITTTGAGAAVAEVPDHPPPTIAQGRADQRHFPFSMVDSRQDDQTGEVRAAQARAVLRAISDSIDAMKDQRLAEGKQW